MAHQNRIHRHNYENFYTVFSNIQFEYDFLSWDSKGLLGYLLSRPLDWVIYRSQLASVYKGQRKGNGKRAIDAMFNELIEYGFIVYTAKDEKTGQFIHRYDVYPEPQIELKNKVPKCFESNMASKQNGLKGVQTSNDCNQEIKGDNNTPVVVPSCLDELKITTSRKEKAAEKFSAEDCERLVQRVKAWKGKKNDTHGFDTILKNWGVWSDDLNQDDIRLQNEKFLDSTAFKDGKTINGHKITIGKRQNGQYIEFVCGNFVKEFLTSDRHFEMNLKDFVLDRFGFSL